MKNKEIIKKAFEKSIPIMCSYLFVSIAYGVMMNEAGFAWYVAILVSFFDLYGCFSISFDYFIKWGNFFTYNWCYSSFNE